MKIELSNNDIARFWSKVRRSDDGCWIWTAARHPFGYGALRVGGRSGRVQHAHRIAYQLAHGSIPDGYSVLHHCDNPPCCRPDHLYAGTQTANLADMTARGRRKAPFSVRERPTPVRGSDPDRFARYRERQRAKRAMLPTIPCACGCGTLIPSVNSMGQPATYALGHNPGGETTRFRPGHRVQSARGRH